MSNVFWVAAPNKILTSFSLRKFFALPEKKSDCKDYAFDAGFHVRVSLVAEVQYKKEEMDYLSCTLRTTVSVSLLKGMAGFSCIKQKLLTVIWKNISKSDRDVFFGAM